MQYDLYSKSVKAVQFKGGGAAIRLNGVGGEEKEEEEEGATSSSHVHLLFRL